MLVRVHVKHGAEAESVPKTEDQALFGKWSGRDDLADPTAYLRRLRSPRPAALQPGSGRRRARQSK